MSILIHATATEYRPSLWLLEIDGHPDDIDGCHADTLREVDDALFAHFASLSGISDDHGLEWLIRYRFYGRGEAQIFTGHAPVPPRSEWYD